MTMAITNAGHPRGAMTSRCSGRPHLSINPSVSLAIRSTDDHPGHTNTLSAEQNGRVSQMSFLHAFYSTQIYFG